MLVKKEIDEVTTQKIITYGTVMLLLFYLMKFIRHMSNRRYYLDDSETTATPLQPSSSHAQQISQPTRSSSYDRVEKKGRRSKRKHNDHYPEDLDGEDYCCNCGQILN